MNREKMASIGILTWVLIGIPSVLWEVEHGSLFAVRAAMLFGAFALFLAAFLIATRRDCSPGSASR